MKEGAPPCLFFQQGACSKGAYCEFSHIGKADLPICKHFAAGLCKRGSHCAFRHSTKSLRTEKHKPAVQFPSPRAPAPTPAPDPAPAPVASTHDLWGFAEEVNGNSAYFYGAAGTVFEKRQAHEQTVSWELLVRHERGKKEGETALVDRQSEEYEDPQARLMEEIWSIAPGKYEPELECGICMTSPAQKHQAYGVLNKCSCVFCLSCIRNWRREKGQRKDTTRSCPLCRTLSYYIVPSFVTFAISSSSPGGEEELRLEIVRRLREAKENTLLRYLEEQKRKVCKYFAKDGFCQFGSSCQFKHLGEDGTEVEETKPRFLLGSDYVSPPSMEADDGSPDGEVRSSAMTPGLVVLGERAANSLADYLEKNKLVG